MSAGFGWSLSEVVLLVNTTQKIIKALSQENGAKSEYQRAIKSLNGLLISLNEVRKILNDVEPVFRETISGQLDDSTSSIAKINNTVVRKYGQAPGENGSTSQSKVLYRNVFRKLSWAFSAAEDLCQFRAHLSEQLNTVKLLMMTNVWQTVLESRKEISASHTLVLKIKAESAAISTEVQQKIDALQALFLPYFEAVRSIKSTVSKEIQRTSQAFRKDLGDLQYKFENSTIQTTAMSRSAMIDHTSIEEHLAAIKNVQLRSDEAQTALARSIETIRTELGNLHQQNSLQAGENALKYVEQYKLMTQSFADLRTRMQQNTHTGWNSAEVINRESQQSLISRNRYCNGGVETATAFECLLRLMAILKYYIIRLLHYCPQIFLYLRLVYNIAQRISFRPLRIMAGDMICLEDFMGQKLWLDKRFFRHFQVFDTFIHNDYTCGVGADKVKRNEYRILAQENKVYEVSEENWSTVVLKETTLIMAITYNVYKRGTCPSCQHPFKRFKPDSLNICHSCYRGCFFRNSSKNFVTRSEFDLSNTILDPDQTQLTEQPDQRDFQQFKYTWTNYDSSRDLVPSVQAQKQKDHLFEPLRTGNEPPENTGKMQSLQVSLPVYDDYDD